MARCVARVHQQKYEKLHFRTEPALAFYSNSIILFFIVQSRRIYSVITNIFLPEWR